MTIGAHIGNDAVLMPSYVNIGAFVGSGTMVDTWATVGSCAQIGNNVHLFDIDEAGRLHERQVVSTLASGNTAHYVGTSDIAMMPSIVDVAGLNRISRNVFTRAAGAICGMAAVKTDEADAKPLIVASMFGNTTECIGIASKVLEDAGYEVLVFHATGTGGKTMEKLIASGMVSGVLDVTTTEWADELVGATLSAGPTRLEAAGKAGVPTVVAPGCLDMANFGERETVPEKFADRARGRLGVSVSSGR